MRQSDRWVTPGVVITGLLVACVIALALIATTAWLSSKGIDSGPVLDLITQIVTAVSALGALVLNLANRASTAKTERNTGVLATHTDALASAVYEVADAMPKPAPRHASAADTAYLDMSAAPAPRGS